MSEVLSQSQIDALINSMRSGDVTSEPEKKEKNIRNMIFTALRNLPRIN